MGYLILTDYQRVIQTTELNAITSNTDSLRQLVETSVQSEVNSSLIQRFDTAQEFSDLQPFNPAISYQANIRIYLNAAAYNSAIAYTTGQLTLQAGNVYSSIAGNSAESFNAGHWNLLGPQYTIFFMTLPYQMFSIDQEYKKGDIVYWKGNIYVNQQGSSPVDQQTALLTSEIESINYGNVVPTDPNCGVQAWGKPIAFT